MHRNWSSRAHGASAALINRVAAGDAVTEITMAQFGHSKLYPGKSTQTVILNCYLGFFFPFWWSNRFSQTCISSHVEHLLLLRKINLPLSVIHVMYIYLFILYLYLLFHRTFPSSLISNTFSLSPVLSSFISEKQNGELIHVISLKGVLPRSFEFSWKVIERDK